MHEFGEGVSQSAFSRRQRTSAIYEIGENSPSTDEALPTNVPFDWGKKDDEKLGKDIQATVFQNSHHVFSGVLPGHEHNIATSAGRAGRRSV